MSLSPSECARQVHHNRRIEVKNYIVAAVIVVTAAISGTAGYEIAASNGDQQPIVIQEGDGLNSEGQTAIEKLVGDLMDRGWTSKPNDHCECIYPPKN
jgi:hypothetical protein